MLKSTLNGYYVAVLIWYTLSGRKEDLRTYIGYASDYDYVKQYINGLYQTDYI